MITHECNIPDQEVLEIAINGLPGEVFPFVRRDFHGKTNEYKSLTDIESLWNCMEFVRERVRAVPQIAHPGKHAG